MRLSLSLAVLFALPAAAFAEEQCQFSEPRDLDLQLTGVKSVLFEVASHDLRLQASPGPGGRLDGRACASSAGLLKELSVSQKRSGDKLVVTLADQRQLHIGIGTHYAYLDLRGTVPDNLLVQFVVGSGDAEITGASAVSADVSSGDMAIHRTQGRVTAKVGAGDIVLDDLGALHVLAVGSGDLKAHQVRGAVEIGKVGSGAVKLRNVAKGVRIGSIGAGDVEIADVQGNVAVDAIGSGDLDVRKVRGDFSVARRGSADIDARDISGATRLPLDD
ncbi:hypothetical protein [Xanthomonas maliensis]|uniref:hypothetical protein n=1 Tax=Xanthomonas maliensis TaxID=1321368 RepID=UPI0004CE7ED2|nr:hypothetical protein [Xanthomonas maliensis]